MKDLRDSEFKKREDAEFERGTLRIEVEDLRKKFGDIYKDSEGYKRQATQKWQMYEELQSKTEKMELQKNMLIKELERGNDILKEDSKQMKVEILTLKNLLGDRQREFDELNSKNRKKIMELEQDNEIQSSKATRLDHECGKMDN
mmetsp:Transcript_19511/g.18632  ORF Transcript_19511/g.18632 Transcript_19511/m.18632 type:complete len:145 (+) Transcript_19511:1077-1511(+)